MAERSERDSVLCAVAEAAEQLGYKKLKEELEMVMSAFVKGNDVFACLPTGFGKSLCYYCLPAIFDAINHCTMPWSIVIVISPLYALMQDQVEVLKKKGLSAVCVLGHEHSIERAKIVSGDYRIIFTTPEVLLARKDWRDVFQSPSLAERLVGIIIDEAHCVKTWYVSKNTKLFYNACHFCYRGSDFRKEFGKLGDLRGYFSRSVNFMALTATASLETRKKVMRTLGMKKPVTIVRSPEKPNILYDLFEKEEEVGVQLCYLIDEIREQRTHTDKTIVFCRTYKDCAELYLTFKRELKKEITEPIGYPNVSPFRLVDMFHACNSSSTKSAILKSFLTDSRLRILVATVAFGMGIDCPNVRRIIHWGPPSNTESYIQETGRAGRDGQPARAILFYSKRDLSHPYMEESIVSYCQNTSVCRRQQLFKYFIYFCGPNLNTCNCCDLCAMLCQCSKCAF